MRDFHEILDEIENTLHLKGFIDEVKHLIDELRSHPVATQKPVVEAQSPVEPAPAPAPAPAPKSTEIDYASYAGYDAFDIRTRIFPSGLPEGWSWAQWSKVSGKPDPETHTAGGEDITAIPQGDALDRESDTIPFGGVTIHARGPSSTKKITGIPTDAKQVMIHGGDVDPSFGARPPFVCYEVNGVRSPMFNGTGQAWTIDAAGLEAVTVLQFEDLAGTKPFSGGCVNVQVN